MSTATAVRILNREVAPLASIPEVGRLLGTNNKRTAYRWAEVQEWPITGEPGGRKVSVIALAERLGIPYQIVEEDPQ